MSDSSSSTITIDASSEQVQEAIFTLENYPNWLSSIKSVEVKERDDANRITKVKMVIDAGMMKDRVTLDYDWSDSPSRLSFSLEDADLLTGMDGSYSIEAIDSQTTQVTYQLSVSLAMPIPAMMRQSAEKTTINQALAALKSMLEA